EYLLRDTTWRKPAPMQIAGEPGTAIYRMLLLLSSAYRNEQLFAGVDGARAQLIKCPEATDRHAVALRNSPKGVAAPSTVARGARNIRHDSLAGTSLHVLRVWRRQYHNVKVRRTELFRGVDQPAFLQLSQRTAHPGETPATRLAKVHGNARG